MRYVSRFQGRFEGQWKEIRNVYRNPVGRYVVVISNVYVGSFVDPEIALWARDLFLYVNHLDYQSKDLGMFFSGKILHTTAYSLPFYEKMCKKRKRKSVKDLYGYLIDKYSKKGKQGTYKRSKS